MLVHEANQPPTNFNDSGDTTVLRERIMKSPRFSIYPPFGVELRIQKDRIAPVSLMQNFKFLKAVAVSMVMLTLGASGQESESVMVVEAYSGKILVASNASAKRPIASLTKIATAVVTVDWATATNTDLGTAVITVPQTITFVGGPNPMNLQPGDQLTLRDALYSAILGSDNLAALTIADHVGREILNRRGKGGDPVIAFVAEMNQLAKALGMAQTKFANPHGLDRPGTKAYSTAADVVRLSAYAMRRNAFNFIARQKDRQVSVSGPGGKRGFLVKNLNELVGEPGILGLKTGTTNAAGPCVSVCMDREPLVRQKPDGSKGATPRRLIVVVLNNPDRFNRARSLIRQGWATYDPWLAAGAPVQDKKREFLSLPSPQ
jgi:D-alanyl-D-alanine carboxypeptidase (penicillin-binding protein 5/6)